MNRFGSVVFPTLLCSLVAHAGLIGQTVTATYFHPDLGTPVGASSVLVGAGVELNCTGGGTGFCGAFDGPPETLDFTDNQIIFTQGPFSSGNYDNAPFNGMVFSNLNMGSPITGISLDTNGFTGLSLANLSFTSNSVTVNLSTIPFAGSAGFTVTLQTAPVPEPAGWIVVLAVLGALLTAGRRLRASQRSLI
jgi:hypothetical protein